MPKLDEQVMRRLASQPKSRDGLPVPNGPPWDCACWNWALSGGTLAADSDTSISTIIELLLVLDFSDPNGVFPTAINFPLPIKADDLDVQAMMTNLGPARTGGAQFHPSRPAQKAFLTALVRVMLRANGLTTQSHIQT